MRIFALDSAARYCSAAIMEGDRLVAESFLDIGLTHSETLLPLADEVFKNAGCTPADIDYFAASCGPGSFTGLRIGIGTLKGMAFAANRRCVAVPTLEALANSAAFSDAVIFPVLDARRDRVYSAAFLRQLDGRLQRVLPDEVRDYPALAEAIRKFSLPAMFVGDAAEMCYNNLRDTLPLVGAAPHLRMLRAAAVAAVAADYIAEGKTLSAEELAPVYLQLSQAERAQNENGGINKDR